MASFQESVFRISVSRVFMMIKSLLMVFNVKLHYIKSILVFKAVALRATSLFVRRAGDASGEHEKGPAMGAIDLREVPRALRFLRWVLPVQRVNIRGKPPIPPAGADAYRR